MLELSKSIAPDEQREIIQILNEAEESLESEDSGEIQQCLFKVEAVASQLIETLMAAV